jgi:DNA-binding LytR/AlgR family response regulator
MINAIAIDDEPLALELLKKFCSQIDYLALKKTFTRTSEAKQYLENFPVDLLFLDIEMPDISGLDFYKSLKECKLVIFTTAFSEYAVEGFTLSAVDYLLKPIKFNRFEQAIIKTRDYLEYINNTNSENDNYLFVRSEYKLYKLPLSEIRYIEGLDNYVRIFMENHKPIMSHKSLKGVCERLPNNMFLRVHRSFIVNTKKNISYSNKYIYIDDKKIPVGISYEENVKSFFRLQ